MRICGKVIYRYRDVTQREWGKNGGEHTLRNSGILGGVGEGEQGGQREKQMLHGEEWRGGLYAKCHNS